MKSPSLQKHARFSLVEVILALGIAAFVFPMLLMLLTVSMGGLGDVKRETVAVSIASMICQDRLGSPNGEASVLYGLPAIEQFRDPVTLELSADGRLPVNTPKSPDGYAAEVLLISPADKDSLAPKYLRVRVRGNMAPATSAPIFETLCALPR